MKVRNTSVMSNQDFKFVGELRLLCLTLNPTQVLINCMFGEVHIDVSPCIGRYLPRYCSYRQLYILLFSASRIS